MDLAEIKNNAHTHAHMRASQSTDLNLKLICTLHESHFERCGAVSVVAFVAAVLRLMGHLKTGKKGPGHHRNRHKTNLDRNTFTMYMILASHVGAHFIVILDRL